MKKKPNPQGKGLSPILTGLAYVQPRRQIPAKHIQQISNELFTSLFVLSARFDFRPVRGKSYWLYEKESKFRLFTIAPTHWSGKAPGRYIGECILQDDMTWTIDLDESLSEASWFNELLQQERQKVNISLQQSSTLEDAMPVYLDKLPYYRRLLAYGLGLSLKTSMEKAGINQLAYKEAATLLMYDKKCE